MPMTTEHVWEAFHPPLQQFIRRRVSDEASAEDVLQDVFLKIHQHVETLKDVKKLESWMYQITRNAIIDSYRSSRPTTTLDAVEVLDLPEELPEDDVVSELLPCVRAMVRKLPELDRRALVLTEYQGSRKRRWPSAWGCPFRARFRACSARGRNSNSSCWSAATLSWTAEAISSTIKRGVTVVKRQRVVLTNC
jgi:RNA polymerase sigma-70 factor, ECF subfamily